MTGLPKVPKFPPSPGMAVLLSAIFVKPRPACAQAGGQALRPKVPARIRVAATARRREGTVVENGCMAAKGEVLPRRLGNAHPALRAIQHNFLSGGRAPMSEIHMAGPEGGKAALSEC